MADLRSIVHMDLDTFFVSCERLLDSRLVGKPILIGGTCSADEDRFTYQTTVQQAFTRHEKSVEIHVYY